MDRLNLAVLISGRGSNLQSIIDACKEEDFPARIQIVISNKADAYGLVRAQQAGIQTCVIDHRDFSSREEFERSLKQEIEKHKIDLICLAGFMRVLTSGFVNDFQNRIINIHPSLLPKHKGLHTHERAIEAGDAESGCTVHYVIPEMDEGPIIVQRSVAVMKHDTPETLAARVLAEEHFAYPEAIKIVAQNILKS